MALNSSQSRILIGSQQKTVFNEVSPLVDETVSWAIGDLLVLKNGLVQKPSSEGDLAAFLGIADNAVVDGKLLSPYQGLATTSRESSNGIVGPWYGVVAQLILKSGDGFDPGDVIYGDPATGPQVISTSGTKAIGVYQGTPVTGTGSNLGPVLLGTRFPSDHAPTF